MENRQNNFQYRSSPLGGIIGLLVVMAFVYFLFLTVKGIWSILAFLQIFLFVGALLLRHSVVTDYGKMLWNTIKEEPIRGLAYSALSFIGFPAVSAFLFFKAFTLRKVEKMSKPKYDEYEEIVENEDFLELPEMEIQERTRDASSSDYEELFD